MVRLAYLGDELTAAGMRLAGVETRVVTRCAEMGDALREALDQDMDGVLVSTTLAAAVPAGLLASALQRDRPLLIVVPPIGADERVPDLATEVREALGIDA